MAIDHTCLIVPKDKFKQCLDVYLAALKPLGYGQRHQYGETLVGLGSTNDPVIADYSPSDFWVVGQDSSSGHAAFPIHLAFTAADRKTVDDFHAAAIRAGAKCNGPPGLRSHYHANYYGAYILDAAGNNIEAVCHKAQ
ncbi:glyoxalase family protein [Hirsutella rhossiliensis]|uniref:Glyoxalase family protein n=1 Tax=Hirsutella rhossiliensis TaxID=111463 RepID=A0A9P8MRV4_9HYPO|nr:glyoxalase family protein [Hirsutella rhossiliensis]KAH0959066.1 glyoxalase family protein [Hirsutella rhossiliensis]